MPSFDHFELTADNPQNLVAFYRELFNWEIEQVPAPGFQYWSCKTEGLKGAITKRAIPQQSLTNYLTVKNLQEWIEKACALGATVLVPKSPVPGLGWYAVLQDPENNCFGFWENDKAAGLTDPQLSD